MFEDDLIGRFTMPLPEFLKSNKTWHVLERKEEREEEEQGYSFTLAKVTKEAFQHTKGMKHSRKCKKIGLDFTVGGWYIEVEELVRDRNFPTTFGFDKTRKYTFDAEAVVANEVRLGPLSQKHNYSNSHMYRELPEEEVTSCDDAGRTSLE